MTEPELKLVDILAIDRTRMAAQRSLLAWVRTALSMITFGRRNGDRYISAG